MLRTHVFGHESYQAADMPETVTVDSLAADAEKVLTVRRRAQHVAPPLEDLQSAERTCAAKGGRHDHRDGI